MDAFWGEIRAFAFSYAPQGWAFCAGNTLAIAQNQALYAVIGTTYGGDGRNTFQLPDMRGRAPMNSGTGPGGGPSSQVGQKTGEPTVTLTQPQMPMHNHTAQGVQALAGQSLTGMPSPTAYASIPRYSATNTTYDSWSLSNPTIPLHPQAVGPAGGGAGHDNLSPYLAMNFCICLDGAVFPTRP